MSDIERVGRVRKGRQDGGFTVVHNSLINHQGLTVEARALMIYLLSRPDDWELRMTDVRRFLGIAGKPCGRDKAYKIVSELRGARYIVMCENVLDKHFAGVTYYIFDEPVADIDEVRRKHNAGDNALDVPLGSPLPEKPEAGQMPLPDFPDPENTEAVQNKDNNKTLIPPTPQQRKTRRRNGSGNGNVGLAFQPIAAPWSVEWMELRTRTLLRGREQAPERPTKFIQGLIDKGGAAGERARLDHAAKSCYPTVKAMDQAATDQARGWRMTPDISAHAAELANTYVSVPIDGPELEAWQEAHRARGWPMLPVPSRAASVWLPAIGVAALEVPNTDRAAGRGGG